MRVLVLCSLIAMGGCAANPESASGPEAGAASAPASQPAAAPASQPTAEAGKLSFDLPPGFKPTRISGELFYCRKMVVLGSRFPQRLCLNQDQLKDYVAGTEEMKRDKEEVSRICTSVDGCAWN